MIFRDDHGYLSAESKDSGDSAVRAGLWSIFTKEADNIEFYVRSGWGVRHPLQIPWNNPRNFTKDQLKMLVAGLFAVNRQDLARAIYDNLKGSWFCPNVERDHVGSVKLKYPHSFYKDSKRTEQGYTGVDVTTVRMKWSWRKFRFVPDYSKLDERQEIESKMFDGPDLLFPNDWEFLKVAAGLKQPSGVGLWFHRLALKIHARSSHNEENQMFAECFVMGTLKEYVQINPRWRERSLKYWSDRNEVEYHTMLVDFFFTEGIKYE